MSRAGALAYLAQTALRQRRLLEYTPGKSLVVDKPWPGEGVTVLWGETFERHNFDVSPYCDALNPKVKAFAYLVDPDA